MQLLTERHVDLSHFTAKFSKGIENEVEFLDNNKMVCILSKLVKHSRTKIEKHEYFQMGYLVIHHSNIIPKAYKDSSEKYVDFRKNMNELLEGYGRFYSMTPKKNKEFYVIGLKIGMATKRKSIDDCLICIRELETIMTKTYGK